MRTMKIATGFSSTHPLRHCFRSVIALGTGLLGLGDMLSAIFPKFHWDISQYVQFPVSHVTRLHAQTLTVVVGFFLIMLSYGLVRGKRHAWRITLLLSLISAFLLPLLRACTALTAVA